MTVDVFESGRGVAGFVAAGSPDGFTSGLVIGGKCFACGATGINDDEVFEEEGRSGHPPFDHCACGIGADLTLPEKSAGSGFECVEETGGAEREDGGGGDGGCCAGACGALCSLVVCGVFVSPEFFAGVTVVADDAFEIAALFLGPEE
ncbi:MAG: hypothetical protein RL215_2136 [Planctomycetota bacterium]